MLTSKSSSESLRNWTTIHTSSAHVSLGYACLPPCRGLVIDHGALPYRAAHKAVNPRQAGPMLILICGVNPGTRVHAGPLRAQSAYQVSPVYDHPAIFTPLPTNSQAEPSGWQKDLGQIFVHWVGCCLSPRPIPPHTPTSLLSLFPFPSRFPLLSFPSRHAQASPPSSHEYSTPQTIRQITSTVTPWSKNFSASSTTAVASTQQHVGQTHPVWRLLRRPAEAATAWLDAPLGFKRTRLTASSIAIVNSDKVRPTAPLPR